MPNIITFTEQFDNSEWNKFDGLVVTADTHAAPTFAEPDANSADTLSDTSSDAQSSIFGTYKTIPNDTSSWITSIFVRKDTNQARFPEFGYHFAGGTAIFGGVRINTQTGALADSLDGSPLSSGVIDVDANWWRVWVRKLNNGTGNTDLRAYLYPAKSDAIDGNALSSLTDSIVAWGINQTNSVAIEEYDPDPFYLFETEWVILATLGAAATSYLDDPALRGLQDYRVIGENTAGLTKSNIVTVDVVGDDRYVLIGEPISGSSVFS